MCKFDMNNYGNFLGSASVKFKHAEDARKAIDEYHGAELDGKVLTIEYDLDFASRKKVNPQNKNNNVVFLRTKSMQEEAGGLQSVSTRGDSGIALGGAVGSANTPLVQHSSGFGNQKIVRNNS